MPADPAPSAPDRGQPDRPGGRYRAVWSTPGAVAFVGTGALALLAHLMTVLSVLLLVSQQAGSFAAAGAVAAGYPLAYAVGAPVTGRLADRYGQGRLLRWAAPANLAARVSFLLAFWQDAPVPALIALSACAGATMPSVGSLVRARWSHLLADSDLLPAALSVEAVLDELLLVISPVVVSLLAAYVDPLVGASLAAVLAAAGLLGLAAQRGTEPATAGPRAVRGPTALAVPGLTVLLGVFAAVAAALSTIELVIIAAGTEHGTPALAGWALAALALGSALGGLWYGSRQWRRPAHRRLAPALVVFAAATLPFLAEVGGTGLIVAAAVLGPPAATTMIIGFLLISQAVPPDRRTEGLSWATSAVGVGIALGTTAGGWVVEARGGQAAVLTAACCSAVAVVLAVTAAARLAPAPDQVATAARADEAS